MSTTPHLAEGFERLSQRLSEQSVTPGLFADPYVDIAWDDPEFAIDPADPRWELDEEFLLSRTDWYRSQPAEIRSRMGLHYVACRMKAGIEFERILKQGLLEFTKSLPDSSAVLRYAYHEIAEEARHALMFLEFVRRSSLPIRGLSRLQQALSGRQWIHIARFYPELFFVFILVGEEHTDHQQRKLLKHEHTFPPILGRIMRIHTAEEARHVGFARHYLKTEVPKLSAARRNAVAVAGALMVQGVLRQAMPPPAQILQEYRVPPEVVRSTFDDNPEFGDQRLEASDRIRSAFQAAGLMTPTSRRLWRRFGLLRE